VRAQVQNIDGSQMPASRLGGLHNAADAMAASRFESALQAYSPHQE
jgi:hypothetical protein